MSGSGKPQSSTTGSDMIGLCLRAGARAGLLETPEGKSPAAHKAMLHAARSIAATALDAILTPGLLDKAKAELREKTAGKPYLCPIPANVVPPSQRG